MIRLVINADDLGLHPKLDEGILHAHGEGVVTSATVLATGPTAAHAIGRANAQQLPLGLHLCLTTHLAPASRPQDVRWLAPGGRFRKNWAELSLAFLSRLIPAEEVALEFRAQVARARALGATIDHLDTHQHLHVLPGMTALVEALAEELGLPMRWPTERPTSRWLAHPRSALKSTLLGSLAAAQRPRSVLRVPAIGVFESGRLNERRLLRLLAEVPQGNSELVTHPGLSPGIVKHDPHWQYQWEAELAAVLSPRVKEEIARRGIVLCSYAQLSASTL
jgi:predicted glycoside hydrolase/deacetylase ChbG (UPF0249 family)